MWPAGTNLVFNVQGRQVFNVSGSLPLIFNGNVPGHEKLFNVRRCSMYTGVQLCIDIYTYVYTCFFNC